MEQTARDPEQQGYRDHDDHEDQRLLTANLVSARDGLRETIDLRAIIDPFDRGRRAREVRRELEGSRLPSRP